MNTHLVSGGCGFVGRNLVKRLLNDPNDQVVIVDDLSIGKHPEGWLSLPLTYQSGNLSVFGAERLIFIESDFRVFLQNLLSDRNHLQTKYNITCSPFHDVYHLAAIVGGRMTIENDPIKVALDLAIDAEFFHWVSRYRPARVLYPSSSAAYPVDLQKSNQAAGLKESDINFSNIGAPDMTYGWSKLTGEYLAQLTAKQYEVSIVCVRPFSGYGEDQEAHYPIPAIVERVARRDDPLIVWGDGTQGRDFVHIEDVLDCFEVAMNKITDGSAINIGTGKPTSFLELIQILTRIAGYTPTIQPLADKPVGVHLRYADMSFVKEKFGWQSSISMEEGMERVYRAIRKQLELQT